MAALVSIAFALAVAGGFLLGFALRPLAERAIGSMFRWGWW